MNGLRGVRPLILQRLVAGWRLLAVLTFGILVAATLLAASPVYTRVMNDLGLRTSLEQQVGGANRNSANLLGLPLGDPESGAKSRQVAAILSRDLGWLSQSESRAAAVTPLTLVREGERPTNDPQRNRVMVVTGSEIEQHLRVVEGRLAQPTNDASRLEVVVPLETARFFGARLGDRFVAIQPIDDCLRLPPADDPAEREARARFGCRAQTFYDLAATMTVVGIVGQTDANESYWNSGFANFQRVVPPDNEPAIASFILPEQTFFQALPLALTGLPYQYKLTSHADITRLNSANLDRTRALLKQTAAAITDAGGIPEMSMDAALAGFNNRAAFNQIPLLLILLQVVGIAIYYVALVASLLAERRAEEVALLRSRGASLLQVVMLSAAEAALLGLVSALVAPFIASGLIAALGKTGTFHDISEGHFLAFTLVPQAFVFALAGASIAVLAVIVPTFFAARSAMVVFLRSSARPGRSFLQRYYVDFGLVGLAAFGLWEINQRGSVFDAQSVGGWSADPLVLFSPFVLIVAIGALMFRFLPLLLSLLARMAAPAAGPGFTLGLWQLTRSPARYTQLALLVVMAAAVGTFTATYSKTTDRSQDQRALFQAGADVRLNNLGNLVRETPEDSQQKLASVPGVEEAATAYRTGFPLGPLAQPGASPVPVLALDPLRAPDLLWFRDDFADESLADLLRPLAGSQAGGTGISLQGEPVSVAVWVSPTAPRANTTLWLRTLDADGTFRLHEFGKLDFDGYRQMVAQLDARRNDMAFPVSIVALIMTQPGSISEVVGGVTIDDLTVLDADGSETVIEDFEGGFRWDSIRTASRNRDVVIRSSQNPHSGNGAANYGFRVGTSTEVRGMYLNDPNIPLPAVVSQRFLDATGLQLGGEAELVINRQIVPVAIRGVTRLFPTMDDSAPGFLIVNQEHLYYYAGLTLQNTALGPNEAWLKLTPDAVQRKAALDEMSDRYSIASASRVDIQEVLKAVRSDPLVRAGGSGVLLIALVAAFSILALGFALTLYLGGQGRTIEVSVMRAMGLSPWQIVVMISLEYLLVAAIGLVIGTIAGLRISETMLSFLNVTDQGGRVVPPFSLSTRWDVVAVAFGATALAFVAGVVGLALYFLRLPVSRVLRLTR